MAMGVVQHFPGKDDLIRGLNDDFSEMSHAIGKVYKILPALAITVVTDQRNMFCSVTRFLNDIAWEIAQNTWNYGHDGVEHFAVDLVKFKDKHRAMAGKVEKDSRDSKLEERWQNCIIKVLKSYLGKPSESHRSSYREQSAETARYGTEASTHKIKSPKDQDVTGKGKPWQRTSFGINSNRENRRPRQRAKSEGSIRKDSHFTKNGHAVVLAGNIYSTRSTEHAERGEEKEDQSAFPNLYSNRPTYTQRDRSLGKDTEANVMKSNTKKQSTVEFTEKMSVLAMFGTSCAKPLERHNTKFPPIPSTSSSKVGHRPQATPVIPHTSHLEDVQGALGLPLQQEENSVLKFQEPNQNVDNSKPVRRSSFKGDQPDFGVTTASGILGKQPYHLKPSHKKQESGNANKDEALERNCDSKYSRPPPPADENPRKRSPNLKDQTFKLKPGSQCISRSPDGNEILIGMKQKIIVCDSNGDPYPDRKPISCGGTVFDVAWINYDCFAMVVDESREVENQPPKISLKVVKGVVSGKPTYHPVELPFGAMPRGITRDENFLYVCDVANAESEVVKMSWLHRFKIKDLKSNEGIPFTKESSTELKYCIRPYKVGCNDKYIAVTDLNGRVLLIKKSEQGLDTQKSFNAAEIIGEDPDANYGPTGVYCGGNIIMVLSYASKNCKYLAADPEDNMKATDIHHLDGINPTGVVVTTGSVSILCIPDNPEKKGQVE